MQNILFTCAGRRNYLINYFKEALNGKGKVIAVDSNIFASALIDADIALHVPDIYDQTYISKLKGIVKSHKVTAIISLNDFELPILSKNKALFEKEGANVIVSNEDVISICLDKWKTYKYIKSIGLNTPKTYISLDKAIRAIEMGKLKFPLVLKPRWGSGSIGVEFPESLEELILSHKLKKIKLKNVSPKEDIDQSVIIQEKLKGKEYGMDIVNNFKGQYFGTFVREKISMRSGETDKATSVIDTRFDTICEKIGNNLRHIGCLDCDAFLVDNELYVLELNPRFGGGYPFSHEAGINVVAIYLEWLRGGNNIEKHKNYKEGVTFSKYDQLIKVHDRDGLL